MKVKLIGIITVALLAVIAVGPSTVSAGGGCHADVPDDKFSDEQQATVEIATCWFTPTVVRIAEGQKVTWTNVGSQPHTVTGAAGTWGSDKGLFSSDSVTYSFDEAGVFPYFCAFHPGMVGAVVVGDGSAANATTARGSVKLVSAQAPTGNGASAQTEPKVSSSGGRMDIPLIAGIALALAGAGAGGALIARKVTVGIATDRR